MPSACFNERFSQPLERHSLLLFRPGRKKKNMVRRSLIVPSLTRLMMLGRSWTTLVQ